MTAGDLAAVKLTAEGCSLMGHTKRQDIHVWCSPWKQGAHLDALIECLQPIQLRGAFGCDRCGIPAHLKDTLFS